MLRKQNRKLPSPPSNADHVRQILMTSNVSFPWIPTIVVWVTSPYFQNDYRAGSDRIRIAISYRKQPLAYISQWRIQDFPGAPTPKVDLKSCMYCQLFPRNCMKMKEIGLRGCCLDFVVLNRI